MRCKQMHINIRYENPKLEAWFLSQMKRAEVIISKALDRVEKLDNSGTTWNLVEARRGARPAARAPKAQARY